jgi:hypothetical protein
MKVIVELVSQSPSTPVTDVAYLVSFRELNVKDCNNSEMETLFNYLNNLNIVRLKQISPELFGRER